MASVTVNSRINSVLLLAQHRTIMLGFPYSHCIKDGKLVWFGTYTKKNCKFECLIKALIKTCKCLPPYLPKSVLVTNAAPLCKYTQHVECTSILLMDFNYARCNCPTPCSELEYKKTVYYTEMHENFRQKTTKLMRRFPDIALASVRISLPENKENQHREEPDYGVSQVGQVFVSRSRRLSICPMLVVQWDLFLARHWCPFWS